MKLPYKIMSSAALAAVVASVPMVVHAQAGDFYNSSKQLKYTKADLANKTVAQKLQAEMESGDTVIKEYSAGKYINYKVASDAFLAALAKNPDVSAALTQAITTGTVTAPVVKTAVSSVSAINATTVQVTVPAALTTAPTVSDFTVLVDGVAVVPTAVVKAANETVKYNLTVPTLTGKEGTLTVNGVAATITGSDFGYDFKVPSVASVVAVDKNHIKVTFTEKVDKTNAELVANYNLTTLDGVTALPGATDADAAGPLTVINPKVATLLSDGKTVLLTQDGTGMTNFKGGYIATVLVNGTAANVIKDVKGNVITSATSTIFDGVGTESTTGPVALIATDNATTGARVIKVKFDKAIASPDKTKITVGGQALTLNDTVAVNADTRVLDITLSTATADAYDKATDKSIALAAGAVKDTATTANDIAATTISVTQAAYLTSATYDESTNKLVLNFSQAVNADTFDPTQIQLNGTGAGNALEGRTTDATQANKVYIADKGYTNKITLDLSNMTAAKLTAIEAVTKESGNRAVLIAANAANVDVNGNQVAGGNYKTNFAYTDDVVAPTLVSASINATTSKMVITFSEPVTVTTPAMLEVTDGTNSILDLTVDADITSVTPVKNTLEVVLTNAGLNKIKAVDSAKLKVKVDKTTSAGIEAVKDAANNKFAKDADTTVALAYTDQNPYTISATANSGVKQIAANQVQMTFDKAIAAADLVSDKFTVAKKDNAGVKVAVKAVTAFNDNKTVVLTLDDKDANFVSGYEYLVATTAKDIYGNPFVAPADITNATDTVGDPTYAPADMDFTLGAVNATAYKLSTAVYEDTNKDAKVDSGDTIKLTFQGAVSLSGDVTVDDFALGAKTNLGTNFAVKQGAKPEEVDITLGTGAVVTLGDAAATIDITPTAANKHILGANGKVVDAAVAPVALVVPDIAKPYITKAVYNDANADGTLGQNDTLTITFSEPIKKVDAKTINAVVAAANANDDFIVAGGAGLTTVSLDSTKVSVDGSTMTIALGAGVNNFVPGTSTIDGAMLAGPLEASDAITDVWGNKLTANPTAAVKIEKSDVTAPTFSNVRVVKADGKTGSAFEVGDKVMFDLSEVAHLAATPAAQLVFYSGIAPTAYDTDANVTIDGKTVTITVTAGDALETKEISSFTSFNITTGADSIVDANGNKIAPAAGFGLSISK